MLSQPYGFTVVVLKDKAHSFRKPTQVIPSLPPVSYQFWRALCVDTLGWVFSS